MLVSVAQKVSEAAKEGGFLGFGGTRVSEQEAATIKELSAALGLNTTVSSTSRSHQDDAVAFERRDRVASKRAHGGAPERRSLWRQPFCRKV